MKGVSSYLPPSCSLDVVVSAGLPLFEDAGYRTFDEFCSHWKENHRILVQRRMLWHIAGSSSFDDPKGIASSSSAMMVRHTRHCESLKTDSVPNLRLCTADGNCAGFVYLTRQGVITALLVGLKCCVYIFSII